MTQREMFNAMAKVVNETSVDTIEEVGFSKDELLEGINARLEALDKKRTSSNKPTKTQIANEAIYANIVNIMADGTAKTCRQITDIYNKTYETDYSTNKLQPQITKAVANGKLTRSVAKGVVYFTATEEE